MPVHLVPFHIYRAERPCRAMIFAGTAADAPFRVHGRYPRRFLVFRVFVDHHYGARRAMPCAVAAGHSVRVHDAILIYDYGMAYLYSPMFDFTPFDGKATFEITLGSANATQAVVALAEADDQQMLTEIESVELPVTSTMTTQRVEFTKGTNNACILVYATNGTYLMFRDFKLTVDMPEGSKIEFPYDQMVVEDGTACRFEEVEYGAGERISYSVVAAKVTAEAQILSKPSNRIYVDFSSSVEAVDGAAAPKAFVNGETLFVRNPNADLVEVFDLAGTCILTDNTGRETITASLAARGVYIVKVGDKAIKVLR